MSSNATTENLAERGNTRNYFLASRQANPYGELKAPLLATAFHVIENNNSWFPTSALNDFQPEKESVALFTPSGEQLFYALFLLNQRLL